MSGLYIILRAFDKLSAYFPDLFTKSLTYLPAKIIPIKMQLLIMNQSKIPVPRKYLAQAFTLFQKSLIKKRLLSKKNSKELALVFLNESAAKKLNKQFRTKDYATDVLSFESSDPESFGELVFCSQVIKKQAKEHRMSFRDECVYMALHGFLHLLGYEHEGDAGKAKAMFKLQDDLFAQFLNH